MSRTGTIRASVVQIRSVSPVAGSHRNVNRRQDVQNTLRNGQERPTVFMSDFERVRKSLERGCLYEDPEFPAVQSTVFYHQTPPFQFVWKRPHDADTTRAQPTSSNLNEICANPEFVVDGPSLFELTPGKLGDKWLVSCLGTLATCRALFYRVVPADQGFSLEDEYCGLFRFRVWWAGDWKEVLIDDRLPTFNGKLVFIHCNGPHSANHFWPALLEKAYAKMYGSYEALKYGNSMDGLSDLTGGVTEGLSIEQPSTLNYLLTRTSIVTALVVPPAAGNNNFNSSNNCNINSSGVTNNGTANGTNASSRFAPSERLPNGIVVGVNYRISHFCEMVTSRGDQLRLVRLRAPIATAHVKDCTEFDRLNRDDQQRALGARALAEGEFFMTFAEVSSTFTTFEVVHLDAETSRDEPSLKGRTPWQVKLAKERWQRGVSSGGCRNNTDTFHMNPQMALSVQEGESVVISLCQDAVIEPKVIGFTVYQCQKSIQEPLTKTYFKEVKSLLSSHYSNYKQVCVRCPLEQGHYVVIPTTFEPGEEALFTLRVFSEKPTKLKCIEYSVSCTRSPFKKVQPQLETSLATYEQVFLQMADEHKCVNAFDLQEILETCLPNDYVKSCATMEVCRQVVLAMDNSGLGRLKYQDYKHFICSLKWWQNVFKAYTKGTVGVLRADRLKEALEDIGFKLNSDVLSLLVLRFMRKDGTLRFGDFVACVLHLAAAFGAFEKKDPLQNGSIKLSLAEWLRASLLC
ncbi:calpain-C-like isoform X2 [Varroa jacobsoni]|uniref:calpain-C-like isoform X2 n=1 Tax=Varroa jacobsoni TaxID=62625 RepID=UPI000BF457E3|nr:calpain-C-like isoform X2 [Varroa jacobsoni]